MQWLKQLFLCRRGFDAISLSIRDHLEGRTEELTDNDMSEEEATRTANREFHNRSLVEQRDREVRNNYRKRRSQWRVFRVLFRLGVRSTWALAACFVCLLGYVFSFAFLLWALLKPFYPREGLWWNSATHTFGIGFINAGPWDKEMLGWWIVPMSMLVFLVLSFLTTRFARWNIRRLADPH